MEIIENMAVYIGVGTLVTGCAYLMYVAGSYLRSGGLWAAESACDMIAEAEMATEGKVFCDVPKCLNCGSELVESPYGGIVSGHSPAPDLGDDYICCECGYSF